jgi:hypothetical protein
MSADLEIVVVDSGSPEDEMTIVAEYQRGGAEIVYVRTRRETIYSAWNRGLALASRRYFANVNVDDWVRSDALELFAQALDRHPDCDVAYSNWATTTSAQQPPGPRPAGLACHDRYQPALPLFYCYTGCVQFWRTRSLRRLGGYNGDLYACGDLEALQRLTLAGGNAVFVPEVTQGYFSNPAGLSRSSSRSTEEQHVLFERARAHTPLELLYVLDSTPTSHAQGWTALGNLAMEIQVPWHAGQLGDEAFARECYRRALVHAPSFPPAIENLKALDDLPRMNHGSLMESPMQPFRVGPIHQRTGPQT